MQKLLTFFKQKYLWIRFVLTRTVKILITNKLVKLTMLWTTGPRKLLSVAQLDAPFDWRPGGRGFNPRRGRQHSFVEIDHEIFSTAILSLLLIQEGQLSVSGERMCTILVNCLEDYACPVNVWLGKLTALDMTPLGWLGRKTSTQTKITFLISTTKTCYVMGTHKNPHWQGTSDEYP